MTFQEQMREAATIATRAVDSVLEDYREGLVTDEDDITGALVGSLKREFADTIAGLRWRAAILRHRKGPAAEEKRIGADLIIHVSFLSAQRAYSKSVLVQAKRSEPSEILSAKRQRELTEQCNKMLGISTESYVFNYAKSAMRCDSATNARSLRNQSLHKAFVWTTQRCFFELFRCSIGDPRITSAVAADLPVPEIISLQGEEP